MPGILGFLQIPSLAFIPFEFSKLNCAGKPSVKVTNSGFTERKCVKRTIVRAEVRKFSGDGQPKLPELTIHEIPYVDEVVKRLSQNSDAFRKTESDLAYLEEAYERCRIICAEHDKLLITVSRQLTKEQQQAIWAIYERLKDASKIFNHFRANIFNGLNVQMHLQVKSLLNSYSSCSGSNQAHDFQNILAGLLGMPACEDLMLKLIIALNNIPMSGFGIFQSPCQIFTSFQAHKMGCAAKPSIQLINCRFLPLKSRKRTNIVRADMSMNDLKCELLIEEIPYVDEVVKRLSQNADAFRKTESDLAYLEEAYERCRLFVSEHEKLTFSVFGKLPKEQRQAIWASYASARRIDDLVDSTNNDATRLEYLDQWEERIEDILNGKPHDILDAALIDTISKFHIDRKPFEEGIEGMRMDVTKKRYANFEELFLYCFCVAGTLGLMLVQIVGIAPESTVSTETIYDGAVYSFIALQLTNILKDVSEDAQLGRIYLPQDELAQFGVCDEDILSRKVTEKWREFMKMQIQRVRFYYNQGEQGFSQFDKASRAKLLSVLMVYGQILDEIEEKDYDNLTNNIGSQY